LLVSAPVNARFNSEITKKHEAGRWASTPTLNARNPAAEATGFPKMPFVYSKD